MSLNRINDRQREKKSIYMHIDVLENSETWKNIKENYQSQTIKNYSLKKIKIL